MGRKTTDVGANLLSKLDSNEISWLPLLRSNKRELHRLWFGIYEDLIYHHGAGFRIPISRIDFQFQGLTNLRFIDGLLMRIRNRFIKRSVVKKNSLIAERVYLSIQEDIDFYQWFQKPNQ